jgi:glycosyltransferase involved in cell wall biosynthesis
MVILHNANRLATSTTGLIRQGSDDPPMRIAIYHSILWSKYKGVVFSELYVLAKARGIDAAFTQIAETEDDRIGLGAVDLSFHRYPFRLLFRGTYERIPLLRRIVSVVRDVKNNPADFTILPGYHRIEYWAMLFACAALGRKRAVFCDSTKFDRKRTLWREIAKRVFFGMCDGYFCYGVRSKEYLLSYEVEESRIIIRYQAAALPPTYNASKVLAYYGARPSSDSEHRFLYVGRLATEKGLWDLLNAFAEVRRRRPDVRLDLVGAGPLKAELLRRVEEMKLGKAVNFLGAKSLAEIAALYCASTALILPSHSEPWGLVVNEALSYGCPVVVSDVCGCVPDLVLDGVTGYSFRTGDMSALANAMDAVIGLSADRVGAAKRCLNLIAGFTPQHAATQILDGCERLLSESA